MFKTVNLIRGKSEETRLAVNELIDAVDCSRAKHSLEAQDI